MGRTKGRLEVGFDADLTILDTASEHRLANADLLYRHRQGPYDGRASRVRVVLTILRGRSIFAQGRIAPGAPEGHFLKPQPSA